MTTDAPALLIVRFVVGVLFVLALWHEMRGRR